MWIQLVNGQKVKLDDLWGAFVERLKIIGSCGALCGALCGAVPQCVPARARWQSYWFARSGRFDFESIEQDETQVSNLASGPQENQKRGGRKPNPKNDVCVAMGLKQFCIIESIS